MTKPDLRHSSWRLLTMHRDEANEVIRLPSIAATRLRSSLFAFFPLIKSSTTWVQFFQTNPIQDLRPLNIGLVSAWRRAQDSERWKRTMEMATLQDGACSWWWWWIQSSPVHIFTIFTTLTQYKYIQPIYTRTEMVVMHTAIARTSNRTDSTSARKPNRCAMASCSHSSTKVSIFRL